MDAFKPNMYGSSALDYDDNERYLGKRQSGSKLLPDDTSTVSGLAATNGSLGADKTSVTTGLPSSATQMTILSDNSAHFVDSDRWEEKTLIPDSGRLPTPYHVEPNRSTHDRFLLVYLIMVIHGIGVLMPWNMFITARDYFVEHKFKGPCTEYSKNFLSYLGIAAQIPNLLLNLLNLFIQFGGSLTRRIVWSIIVIIIVFIFTIILAIIDSSNWQGAFFALTMASVVLLNCANGVYQNSIYGVAADLPMKYSNAVVFGNNISGTLTALVLIISIAVSSSQRIAAIYYFLAAVVVLLICFDTYFLLPRCRFYRHYKQLARTSRQEAESKKQIKPEEDLHYGFSSKAEKPECCSRLRHALKPYAVVFAEAYPQMFSVFFTFFVTLTIFPAIQADVKPLSPIFKNMGVYFTPVTTFFLFNFFAMVGNIIPNCLTFPPPRFLWIPVLIRGFMIPYFMLCNYRPHLRTIPVFINDDWAYVIMAVLMAITSGYFSSLSMMYAPRVVKPEHAAIAGMMAALFLILGINCGIGFSLVVAKITETMGPLTPIGTNRTACL